MVNGKELKPVEAGGITVQGVLVLNSCFKVGP
jgi:hypothetical protein